MREERAGQGNGSARRAPPLGDVARDVLDHATIIARDEVQLARLSARRYAEHLRREVAPHALLGGAGGVCAGLAALFALLALFLGIAQALGSVAWAFVIYAALFAAGAAVLFGLRQRRVTQVREDILGRLPIVEAHPGTPSHALLRQETPEAHRLLVDEARREAQRGAAAGRPG